MDSKKIQSRSDFSREMGQIWNDWQPIKSAPKDGTPFLAVIVDYVDEYDENNNLIGERKRETHICVAQQIAMLGGPVEIPWRGNIVQGRKFTHWMPLPKLPADS